MRYVVLTVALLAGCDDTVFTGGEGEPITGVEGFEGVSAIVQRDCLGCHSSASALGGLDMETDLHSAIVGVDGDYGMPIVDPGAPENSSLFLKVTANQAIGGTDMPPGTGGLDASENDLIQTWILDGAPAQ